jgi:cytochrome c2
MVRLTFVRNHLTMKKLIYIAGVLLCILVVLQFFRPRLENPPVTQDLVAPAAVKQVFRKSCYSCHSNETSLSWYDKVVPAYWLVASHVRAGRKVVNFSHWDSLNAAQQSALIFESFNQMTFATMPLGSYTAVHHGAIITPEDLQTIRQYLTSMPRANLTDTARLGGWLRQYLAFTNGPQKTAKDIQTEYNGISIPADFAYWEVVNTSERWDNGTMRAILGNPIAIKAIREGHTNPWPDGASFAKVGWVQRQDSNGVIHAGAFTHAEFMFKDAEKYASTDGWGWARWVGGINLIRYGKNETFVTECMNCHQPMKAQDFMFTFPTQRDSLGAPADSKILATFIDSKTNTMSTLFGNDVAMRSARSAFAGPNAVVATGYQEGTVLTLVTRGRHEDPHWFGANIPGSIQSVEMVQLDKGMIRYEGKSISDTTKRIKEIMGIQPSILPVLE